MNSTCKDGHGPEGAEKAPGTMAAANACKASIWHDFRAERLARLACEVRSGKYRVDDRRLAAAIVDAEPRLFRHG